MNSYEATTMGRKREEEEMWIGKGRNRTRYYYLLPLVL